MEAATIPGEVSAFKITSTPPICGHRCSRVRIRGGIMIVVKKKKSYSSLMSINFDKTSILYIFH